MYMLPNCVVNGIREIKKYYRQDKLNINKVRKSTNSKLCNDRKQTIHIENNIV